MYGGFIATPMKFAQGDQQCIVTLIVAFCKQPTPPHTNNRPEGLRLWVSTKKQPKKGGSATLAVILWTLMSGHVCEWLRASCFVCYSSYILILKT